MTQATADERAAGERYVWQGPRRLRCGYTTGSCAALAAGAAAAVLLGEAIPRRARLVTPRGVPVEAPVEDVTRGGVGQGAWASCAVRKDAGDDVDATDGMLVYARVERAAAGETGVLIDGGVGIGRVTKPGLDQPVGAAAINSVPRRMIAAQVAEAFARHGLPVAARVTISAPEGEAVAARTFNPQLGVVGGISILGTSGVVEPLSLDALRDSVTLEIAQLGATGGRDLVLVPGNYGADFCDADPRLAPLPRVACSNFIGDALDAAARAGLARVLVVGHVGKLVKVAAGVMNTHSRVADCRLETLCAHAAMAGADASVARAVMEAPTTDAGLDVLDEAGLLPAVCASVTRAVAAHVERRLALASEGAPPSSAVIMFSRQRGELGRSEGADALVAGMTREVARG